MTAVKIRIFSVIESQENCQAIRRIIDLNPDLDVELDWTNDLGSGLDRLQQKSDKDYDLYILDDRVFSLQKNPEMAIATSIDLLSPASVIILAEDDRIGLNAIKMGAIDYLLKEKLTATVIEKSLYLFLNLQKKSKLSTTTIYHKIFYNSCDGMFILKVDEEKRLTYEAINPAYGKKVGITPIEIVGKNITEVIPEDRISIIQRKLITCIETKESISYEISRKRDGKNHIYHTTVVPIVDSSGKVIELQGSSRDLTEEKEAIAQQIRQTRYRNLLRSLALKIHQSSEIQEILQASVREILKTLQVDRVLLWQLVDRKRKIITEAVNHNIKPTKIRLLPQEEELGQVTAENFQHRSEACCQVTLEQYSPARRDFFQKEGIVAFLDIPIYRVFSSEGNRDSKPPIWGSLSLYQCCHSRRWTNEEIEILQEFADRLGIAIHQNEQLKAEVKKKDELIRANAELEQFAYIASHDLQAPLQTIGNYSKLLQRRYHQQIDEKADKFLRYIVEAAHRMQEQIQDLLEYSRVGKRYNRYEIVDCQLVLNKAISNLRLSIDKNKARIDILNPLPALVADSNQFFLLWQNLIANAIVYRTEELPIISISSKRQGNYWLFEIADNGIGIDSKYYRRIFQIFQRLHTQEEYPGTGIGLAICQRIVENHHGHIWVHPNRGGGSVFCFTISATLEPSSKENEKNDEEQRSNRVEELRVSHTPTLPHSHSS
jgi:PAS domain S-box-containing protein